MKKRITAILTAIVMIVSVFAPSANVKADVRYEIMIGEIKAYLNHTPKFVKEITLKQYGTERTMYLYEVPDKTTIDKSEKSYRGSHEVFYWDGDNEYIQWSGEIWDTIYAPQVWTMTKLINSGYEDYKTIQVFGDVGFIMVGDDDEWIRLAGADRYKTAVEVSNKAQYPGLYDKILLTTGADFADALAASSLVRKWNSPLLLTKKNSLPAEIADRIVNLSSGNATVYIIGGEGAVSKEVENKVAALDSVEKVVRIAGETRIQTPLEIYNSDESWSDTCIIANGWQYADALSIGVYAASANAPILVTRKNGDLRNEVLDVIKKFKKAIIVGGTAVVSEATEKAIKNAGLTVLRLAGSNRYETSQKIALWELGMTSDAVFQPDVPLRIDGVGIATGRAFPDALSSINKQSYMRQTYRPGAPLLLVSYNSASQKKQTDAAIQAVLKNNISKIETGYIYGGESAVGKDIEDMLKNLKTVPWVD